MNEFLLILIFFYISIVLHEIIHCISYIILDMKIKKFYFFPFDWTEEGLKIRPELGKNYFGIVLPYNYKGYTIKQLRRKLMIALVTPSIVHLFTFIGGMFVFCILKDDIFLDIALVNLLCALSTLTSNENVYGDWIAFYHLVKNDETSRTIINSVYDM